NVTAAQGGIHSHKTVHGKRAGRGRPVARVRLDRSAPVENHCLEHPLRTLVPATRLQDYRCSDADKSPWPDSRLLVSSRCYSSRSLPRGGLAQPPSALK